MPTTAGAAAGPLSSRGKHLVGAELERCIFCRGTKISREGKRYKKLETSTALVLPDVRSRIHATACEGEDLSLKDRDRITYSVLPRRNAGSDRKKNQRAIWNYCAAAHAVGVARGISPLNDLRALANRAEEAIPSTSDHSRRSVASPAGVRIPLSPRQAGIDGECPET